MNLLPCSNVFLVPLLKFFIAGCLVIQVRLESCNFHLVSRLSLRRSRQCSLRGPGPHDSTSHEKGYSRSQDKTRNE